MIWRPFWLQRIHSAWERVPVVWLSGVRRVGKTTIAKQIPGAILLNCDLPSTSRRLEDPERFYRSADKPVIVFDEIHQLADPSTLLKIGADEFPDLRFLAAGPSTLAATAKFRDSLTGRKRTIHLLPVLDEELTAFGIKDLRSRLHRGGLPEALLAKEKDAEFYTEWLDSYFARDVQELFRVGKRREFLTLVELLLRSSGGLLEVASVGKHAQLSRPTVTSYLEALQTTHVITLIRPFHGNGRQELLKRPKAYGFDTGFVAFYRGWDQLRAEDCGPLWEHIVLETLLAHERDRQIRFWRDKRDREVDFVLVGRGGRADTIECKWRADGYSARNLRAFRDLYPGGHNYVVSPQADEPYVRALKGLEIVFCNLGQWVRGEAAALVPLR